MAQKVQKALNLDQKSQRKFIEFYIKEVQSTSKDARVFHAFERTDYYSIHGDDIDIALKTSLKSSIITKIMAPDESKLELKYAVLNKNLMERLIRELLLIHFYRVEVYTCKKGDKDDYLKTYKGSPGNLVQFENLLSNSSSSTEVFSNLIVSLQVLTCHQQKKIAICSMDSDEFTIQVSEFDDTDFFMELEAAMVILSPKEVLLPKITGEYSKIKDIMDRNNILVTLLKKSDFQKNAEFLQDLEKIHKFKKGQQHNIHSIAEVKLENAMECLAAALKYLETVKDETNLGKYTIKSLNLNRFVHMDTAAFKALNLFPVPGSIYCSATSKNQSVLGVLDRCKTNQGKKLLRQWIKQPLKNMEMIKERLDILECFVENQEARSVLHNDFLNTMPDVLMLTNKLSRKRAQLVDVYKIYCVISRLPEIMKVLRSLECNAVNSTMVSPLKDMMQDLKKIQEMFEEVIDAENLKKGEYLVRSTFDDELNDIKQNMDCIEDKLAKETKSSAKLLGLDMGSTLKLDYVSHLGFYLRTTKKEDKNVRKHSKFIVIDTARGGLRFTTDLIKGLNEEYVVLKASYEDQQKNIVAEICRIVAGYSAPLMNLNHIIAVLDLFLGLANVVQNSPGCYVRPEIYPASERILQIEELRHPCLECQDDIQYIPNSVDLQADKNELLIITGSNISGKSTYIRSIGIAVLLSHMGMFVPCESAKISICDSILARIGATDDIQKNLSTFAMEMVETSSILKTATKNSLVIIDELGRGTSTFEGLGLAWSISEYLAKTTKCFTLFATHFHEITSLADSMPNVKNYHLASLVENEKLTLLFKVKPGPMTKSFGIQVADIAQLPKSVVTTAKKYLSELECSDFIRESDPHRCLKIDEFLEKIKKDKSFDINLLASL
ncbi:DNA mismatch repair protein spellchecker 1 [Chironomus tepperi]|uniref:DNA mismatch repair protein spellchecker 1 n=1 Tax=Chironomus tepperi TaxID=113505 RepID=UPI00391EF7FE